MTTIRQESSNALRRLVLRWSEVDHNLALGHGFNMLEGFYCRFGGISNPFESNDSLQETSNTRLSTRPMPHFFRMSSQVGDEALFFLTRA
jgi:hypothetical protein